MKRIIFFSYQLRSNVTKTTVNSTVKNMCLVYVFEPSQNHDNTRVELGKATYKAGLVCYIQRHN